MFSEASAAGCLVLHTTTASSPLSLPLAYTVYYSYYRTASNVGRPLIKVVTPWNIANDILRNVLIKSLIDYL